MRIQFIIWLSIMLIFNYTLMGQDAEPNFSEIDLNTVVGYNNLNPQVPEAGDLGTYGQTNIDYATGRNNTNIPIHTINVNEISLPISLSYTQRAFRVAEADDPIALGWSLNANYSISRTVRGLPDEDPYGFKNTGFELNEYYELRRNTDPEGRDNYYDFLKKIYDGVIDGQADEFQFSAGSANGRFYYHNDENFSDISDVVTIPFQAIKIEDISEHIELDPSNPDDCNFLQRLLGHEPDGNSCQIETLDIDCYKNKYYGVIADIAAARPETNPILTNYIMTGNIEGSNCSGFFDGIVAVFFPAYKITTNDGTQYIYNEIEKQRYNSSGADTEPYISKFMVSYIVSSNKKDTIKFSYDSFDERNPVSVTNFKLIGSNGIYPKQFSDASKRTVTNSSTLGKKILKEIVYPTGRVEFEGSRYINRINIYNNIDENPIKTIRLSANNFQAYEGCQDFCERRKLNSITINNDQVYTFHYNDMPVPGRNSKAIDHFGYYNGAHSNATLLPSFEYLGYSFGDGANREINSEFCDFGTMTSMEFPTGGKQYYYYGFNSTKRLGDVESELVFEFSVSGNDDINQVSIERVLPGVIIKEFDEEISFDLDEKVEYKITYITPADSEKKEQSNPINYSKTPRVLFHDSDGNLIEDRIYNDGVKGFYNEADTAWHQVIEREIYVPNLSEENSLTVKALTSESSRARILVEVKIKYKSEGYNYINLGGLKIDSISVENEGQRSTTIISYAEPVLLVSSFDQIFNPEYLYVERYNTDNHPTETVMPYNNFFAIYDSPNSALTSGDIHFYPEVKVQKKKALYKDLYTFRSNSDIFLQDYPKSFKISNAHLRGQILDKKQFKEGNKLLQSLETSYSERNPVMIRNIIVAKNREYATKVGMGGTLNDRDPEEFISKPVEFFASVALNEYSIKTNYDENSWDENLKQLRKVEYSYTGSDLYFLPREIKTFNADELNSTQRFIYGPDLPQYNGNDPFLNNFIAQAHDFSFAYKPIIIENTIEKLSKGVQYKFIDYIARTHIEKSGLIDGIYLSEILPYSARMNFVSNINGSEWTIPNEEFPLMSQVKFNYDQNNLKLDNVINKEQITSYLYSNDFSSPVAKTINAESNQTYFEGFEAASFQKNGFSRTGKNAFQTDENFIINQEDLNLISGEYLLSYWFYKSDDGEWEYVSFSIAEYIEGTDIIINTDNLLIDDIRIHPLNSFMTTYTYDEGVGLTSVTDQNNITTYFKYYNGRLIKTLDHDKNLISTQNYNFKR